MVHLSQFKETIKTKQRLLKFSLSYGLKTSRSKLAHKLVSRDQGEGQMSPSNQQSLCMSCTSKMWEYKLEELHAEFSIIG